MPRILIQFMFLFFLSTLLFSQEESKYFLAFCAKEAGKTSRAGHAFVVFGVEDAEAQMSRAEAWGFYPKKGSKAKEFVIGEVPGEIRDDFLTKVDHSFVVEVSMPLYNEALGIKNKWQAKDYELLENDCVSFLVEVVGIVDGLKLPDRKGLAHLPAKYLQKLIDLNK